MASPVERDGLSMAQSVGAGASGNVTYDVRKPAVVERVGVRFYPGPELELDLEVKAVGPDGSVTDLVELEGKDVIDGDDDLYVWHPSIELERNSTIRVEHTNNDAQNAYDYRVNLDLDYRGELVARLAGALGEVI